MREESFAGSWAAPPEAGRRRRLVSEYLEACSLDSHLNYVTVDFDNYVNAQTAFPERFGVLEDGYILEEH